MPVYQYQAKVSPHQVTNGTIEAENERAAVHKLLRANCHPLWLRPQRSTAIRPTFFSRHSQRDPALFFRQLANLLQAGLPLIKALNNIIAQPGSQRLHSVLKDVREHIQRGNSLSQAMGAHPEVFNSLEVNVIKSGEASGQLAEVIAKIADVREKDLILSQKIGSALAYPLLLSAVGAMTLFVLTSYVLPKFVVLFQDLDQELPLLTAMLVRVSLFSERYWAAILLSVGALIAFGVRFARTGRGRLWIDTLLNTLWFSRILVMRIQTGKFSRTLASLLESGVPILTGLAIVADTMSNRVYRRVLKQVHTQVAQGRHLSEALGKYKIFEPNTVDLIAVGEQGGQMPQMLTRIADMNERDAGRQLESLVFMLEPLLILLLGGVIGIIVMAILLPIFEINFIAQ